MFAVVFVLSAGAFCSAQNSHSSTTPSGTMPAAPATEQAEAGGQQSVQAGTIPVELAKSLDAKKLKQGDPVEARVVSELRMGDGTVIPRGSKVTGHITKAEARAKGDAQSQLGISFDQIVLKDGKDLPLKSSIQAVGPPPGFASVPQENDQQVPGAAAPGPIGAGAPPAGLGAPQPNLPSNPSAGTTSTQPSQNGQPAGAQITSQSTGVVGLHDLQLEPGSILASGGKDVKLDAGSQVLLRVQDQ
jgi:hypothetical protein